MSRQLYYSFDKNSEEVQNAINNLQEGQSYSTTSEWGSSECSREDYYIITSLNYTNMKQKGPIPLSLYRPCLKCNKDMLLCERFETSDGMCGVYYLTFLCSNDACRLKKVQKIETYAWLDF